jgi:hypothetical protein
VSAVQPVLGDLPVGVEAHQGEVAELGPDNAKLGGIRPEQIDPTPGSTPHLGSFLYSSFCAGSKNSHVTSTKEAVRVGIPNGVSADTIPPCTITVRTVATRV